MPTRSQYSGRAQRMQFALAATLLVSMLPILVCAGVASAQSVPGFLVETFSTPQSPNLLAFGADGVLYAGRDDNPAGSITAVPVSRITADGTAMQYGGPILDPDALVVDEAGVISGVPGAVLVGGLITNPGPGRITAIRPDQSMFTLFEAPEFGNISELKFDATGRLLFVSLTSSASHVSNAGEQPTVLCPAGNTPIFLTVAPDGRLFTSNQAGTVRVNAADGTLINAAFAQFNGRASIEFAQGGGFGTDLLALEPTTGKIFSVSPTGVKTEIGSGFASSEDLAVGPCGALYVSRRTLNQVLQVSRVPSPDINDDGIVNGADLAFVLGAWQSADCAADLNEDGIVSGADLAIVLGSWGEVP